MWRNFELKLYSLITRLAKHHVVSRADSFRRFTLLGFFNVHFQPGSRPRRPLCDRRQPTMFQMWLYYTSLQWRHNGCDSVWNHQPHDCLLNRLFRRRSKKPSKLRVTGLCEGNSPGNCEFPAQRASNAENVSIWWRHNDYGPFCSHAKYNYTKLGHAVVMNIWNEDARQRQT